MKITIAYLPAEEQTASSVLAALRQQMPGMKIRHSDAHPPVKHIYLSTKKPMSDK